MNAIPRTSIPQRGSYCLCILIALAAATATPVASQQSTSTSLPRISPQQQQIGALDFPDEEVFGTISGIAVDAQNRVYVLDYQAGRMAIFDEGGRHIASTGRRGRGPGELFSPAAVALSSDSRVHVLDPPNMRVTTYRLRGRDLETIGSFRLPFVGRGLCTIGERIFIQGDHHEGYLIHEYSAEGTHRRSFSSAGRPTHPAMGSTLSAGHLLCMDQLVIYKTRNTPDLRVHRSDGSEVWSTKLSDFVELTTVANEDGSITFSAPRPDGHDYTSQLFTMSDRILAVQLGKSGRETDEEGAEPNPRTILLDLVTGREIGEGRHLPPIAKIQGNAAYSLINAPYPQIRRHTLLSSGGR